MCSSSSSSRRRTRSPATRHRPPPMTRGTRTKTRRPKFLSLRRQLAPPRPEAVPDVMPSSDDDDHNHHHHLLEDPHVACLLDVGGCGGATLTDLLGGGGGPEPATTVHEPLCSPSPTSSSMNWDGDEEGLARRVLRGRERWVFCRSSSTASPSSSSGEVASSSCGRLDPLWCGAPQQGLSLKLDYEEILTAWSDRGSLYIDGDGAQVVPEFHETTMFVEVGSSWRVPEVAAEKGDDRAAADGEGKEEEVRSREARVLRYKEKRRSRLFAKRIRYEVRKLNAEKRPRMKGRFVKRKDDE